MFALDTFHSIVFFCYRTLKNVHLLPSNRMNRVNRRKLRLIQYISLQKDMVKKIK